MENDRLSPEEGAEQLFYAARLFIHYSVQDYLARGIIQAHESPH